MSKNGQFWGPSGLKSDQGPGPITAASFSRDGNYFASGGSDEQVLVWKTNFDQMREGNSSSNNTKTKRKRDRTLGPHPTVEDIPPRQDRISPRPLADANTVDARQEIRRLDDVTHGITNVIPTNSEDDFDKSSTKPETSAFQSSQSLGNQLPQQLTTFMQHVAGQLDILTQTVSLLEQRLTMTENKLSEFIADGGAKTKESL
ncbi:poc1 centriolar protein a [Plakobranchus ocellatus]|uniref:Poc1 centriolar protein a n=1 Tax=Plakobranchus ocellatus TaxID=259542 RepID=A0AAV3ZS89_9GAST|nr:poc1 centriolar protein a [Plakobranchus ocellatus]